MKKTITYVRRYYKAYSVDVDIPEGLDEIDYLDSLQENWDRVIDQSLEFEDKDILTN